MARNTLEKESRKEPKPVDRPAATLLRSWGKKMSEGKATVIPVYVGGTWTLAVPRGNKRVLSLSVSGVKSN
jgi:hypothetical protein